MRFSDENNLNGIVKSIDKKSKYKKSGTKNMLIQTPVILMKKGGKIKQMSKGGNPCPEGYYWGPNGDCIPQAKKPGPFSSTSAKIGAGIIGAGVTALGAKVAKNISEKRKENKAIKKTLDETAKKVTNKVMKKGGSTGDKKWIQKAINPAHKGYCTPMTKPTCTPKRKALAITLKKMAKKK